MNILYISDFFQPYGNGAANISTYITAKKMAQDNSVYVITQNFQNKPWEYQGLTVLPLLERYSPNQSFKDMLLVEFHSFFKLQNLFSFYKTIKKFYKQKNIEIINVQSNNLTLLISLLLLNKPIVIDVRDYYFTCPFMLKTIKCDKHHIFCVPSYLRKRTNIVLNLLSVIFVRYQTLLYFFQKNLVFKPLLFSRPENCTFIANSKYVEKKLIKEFGEGRVKTQVIYNPINEKIYNRNTNKIEKIVLYASSIENSKGIWDCIKSFEKFKDDVIFEVAGDGPELDSIKQYIKNKKIMNIRLLGSLEYKNIPPLYEKAYITVQPSVWPEPFGRYILESFGSKTPLITTPTGGTPEAITNRETGILVAPNNPRQLTKAISELLTNKNLYKKIVKNISNKRQAYGLETIYNQRINLYQRMISHHK